MSRWTRRRLHTSLGFIKVDLEAKIEVDSRISNPAIDPAANKEIETEEILIVGTIIDPIIERGPEIIIDVTTEEMTTSLMKDEITIDKTAEEEIAIDRIIEIDKVTEELALDKDLEIGVKVVDRSRNYSSNSARGRDRNRDRQVQQRSRTLSDDRERSRPRSNSRVSTNRD